MIIIMSKYTNLAVVGKTLGDAVRDYEASTAKSIDFASCTVYEASEIKVTKTVKYDISKK